MGSVLCVLVVACGSAMGFSGVTSDGAAIAKFNEWLTSNKLPPHKVKIGAYHKLVATEDIAAEELRLSIPFNLLISPKTAGDGALGPALKDIALPSPIVLTLFLVNEKNDPKSFYQPWLSILPERIPSSLFFDEAEMGELQGSMMQSITQQRNCPDQRIRASDESPRSEPQRTLPSRDLHPRCVHMGHLGRSSRSIVVNAGNVTVPIIVPF